MNRLFTTLLLFFAASAGAATRPPAVAGAFYTADPVELRSQVGGFLEAGKGSVPVRALVVPHAGYVYSGAVAGKAFAGIDGESTRRVILLGPSHHMAFGGGALPARSITAFKTPLGDLAVDTDSLAALREHRDFKGPAGAHDPEHCLEVELPFIQTVAPKARIVPILIGHETDLQTARRMAIALTPLLDPTTVVVVSSDFTHHGKNYRWSPFSEPDLGGKLVRLGRITADRLAAVDPVGFWRQVEVSGDTVCGARPSVVLAELLANAFDGSGEVLDVTTSGHVTGSWDLVVTYASVAFRGTWKTWKDSPQPKLGDVTDGQGSDMVALARAALESYLLHDGSLAEWYAAPHNQDVSRALAGAFVTLNNKGKKPQDPARLRACMGVIEAKQPLEEAVVQAAVWAAQDPRFPRLAAAELENVEIEVSVLSPAYPVAGPGAIDVGTHGVILTKGRHRSLFLPQVATEQGWNRQTMLDHLARKAGLTAGAWRDGASFEVFTAQIFGEGH